MPETYHVAKVYSFAAIQQLPF